MQFFSLQAVTTWKRARIYTIIDLNDKERSSLGYGLKYYLQVLFKILKHFTKPIWKNFILHMLAWSHFFKTCANEPFL